jgi:alkylhydroperoxidase family enzyme
MAEEKPFIPYADRDALPDGLKAPLEAYEQRMGFMPNALKLYMHRPELLACLVQLNNTAMRDPSSHLDAGLKRRISAICSYLNKSAYCVAHNTNTLMTDAGGDGEGWDFSDEDVMKLLDPAYSPDDAAEKAAIDYARAATVDHSNVPRAVLDRLAETMTPPQVVELACVVGFWKMYNSIHEALHVPIEETLQGNVAFLDA